MSRRTAVGLALALLASLLVVVVAVLPRLDDDGPTTRPPVPTPTPTPTPTPGPTPAAAPVVVAQGNLKVSLSREQFAEDLAAVVDGRPDLVSLNEVGRRSDRALTPRGYAMHRGPATEPRTQTRSTAVLWRTDRWTRVRSGRVLMVADGPQKWDAGRSATWATLRRTDGLVVSVVSVHHMINPGRYGPDRPRRQALYREGVATVRDLAARLSARGPVFVAGDFNASWRTRADWGPRSVLGPAGFRPTMAVLGRVATHDAGAVLDQVYFQRSSARPVRQWTAPLHSDHHLLAAEFEVVPASPA